MKDSAPPTATSTAHRAPSSLSHSGSPLDALRHRAFAVIWFATIVSNIGMWIQSAAAGWLMTKLNPDPRLVAMVQVVTVLPMFMLALPAGAMADIVDRRRLLLAMEVVGTLLTFVLALLVSLQVLSPWSLLALIFLAGIAYALDAPAWQAIVPQLVGHEDLSPAVALNSVGMNISRAIGPALAGVSIGYWGIGAPFWINAVSNLGVIGALYWWRESKVKESTLPPERLLSAIRLGLRHARHNPSLRSTLMRASGFFLFATAYWALLPLVARNQMGGGAQLYGLLLGAIGVGALAGAFGMSWAKARFGPDGVVAVGTAGTAVALVLFATAHHAAVAFYASLLAGVCWISVLTALNVAAQESLPGWVRGRGLAAYATVMHGAMTLGSMLWGEIAAFVDLSMTLELSAAGALATIPLLHRWKLPAGAAADLAPSSTGPESLIVSMPTGNRGPVLITIEYDVVPDNRTAFLAAIRRAARGRERAGAYDWGIFEDVAIPGRWLESFRIDSWIEHLRQHARVSNADRLLQDEVHRFQITGKEPRVTQFVAAEVEAGH